MSDFYLSVTEARVEKEHGYQDAFANVPCECCDSIQPVFAVSARYASTTLLQAYTPESGVEGAVAQAMQLYRVLCGRIDAANLTFEQEEARKAAEEAEAAGGEFSDLVGDEAEAS